MVACMGTLYGEHKLKPVNLQTSAIPVPKSIIYIADAAAIKVRPLYDFLIELIHLAL